MGTANWPGSSEESNLSGPSVSGLNLGAALENYFAAALQAQQEPGPRSPQSDDGHFPTDSGARLQDTDPLDGGVRSEASSRLGKNTAGPVEGNTAGPDEDNAPGLIDEDDFFDWAADLARQEWANEEQDGQESNELDWYSQEGSGQGPIGSCGPFEAVDEPGSGPTNGLTARQISCRAAARQRMHRNVLRSAEPLTMPTPIKVELYGGTRRVQRLLPPMTAEEQANYVPWAPQRGAAALDEVDPATLPDEDLLNYIQATERQASWAMARQAAAINEFATRRPPVLGEKPPARHQDRSRYAAAELMALFAIGAGAAEHLIADAELLVRHLPDTFEQFNDGSLDMRHVKAVVRGCENTPPHILHALETQFLNFAMSRNPNALARSVRGISERNNPEPLEERHKRARTSRDVWMTPLPDGMACLGARLPATEAALLYNSLEEWARAAKSNGEDSHGATPSGRPSRALSEYRADVLMDLLHQVLLHDPSGSKNPASSAVHSSGASAPSTEPGGPHFRNRIPVVLNITVPASRLLGNSADPAMLEGYGPIPVGDVRELAATAKFWRRFLTDPDTGRIVSVGRKRRKPPKAMAREVRFRDPVCTGIGCDRPARSCDLDHTTPFTRMAWSSDGSLLPPGDTSLENLRPRCPYCHHVKDDPQTGWTVENVSPGVTRTITPTGRVYLQTQGDIAAPF